MRVCVRCAEECRYCSGESFEREHWATLYSKLGLPTNSKFDELTVGDFLDVQDTIIDSEVCVVCVWCADRGADGAQGAACACTR